MEPGWGKENVRIEVRIYIYIYITKRKESRLWQLEEIDKFQRDGPQKPA